MLSKLYKNFKRKFDLKIFLVICLAVLLYSVFVIFVFQCPPEHLLGIPCPFCGLSRAFFSLARFDIAGAFYYHPLFPLIILMVVFEFLRWLEMFKISKKTHVIIYGVVFLAFIIVFIIRHILGSQIVEINLESGKIFQCIK